MPSSNDTLPPDGPHGRHTEVDDQLSELIDDPDFRQIDGRFGGLNIFNAIGAVTSELRHSNLLAFLLSPSRPHGIGSELLERLLCHLLGELSREERPLRPLEIAIGDLENTVVHRERYAIDLLIEVREINLVVLIENKVLAKAGEGQLARYRALIEREYPTWRHLLVFLTPEGDEPDEDGYVALSYLEIARLLDELLKTRATSLSDDIVLIISHYVEMLRRHIVPDEELRVLALKVYERHKEAIDFIIDALPQQDDLNLAIRDLIDAADGLALDASGASIVRFFPTEWAAIPQFNCCPPDRWTRTGRNLLFEVKFQKNEKTQSQRVALALVLGPSDHELREFIFTEAQQRAKRFAGCRKRLGKNHVTIFTRELLSRAESEDGDTERQIEILTSKWNEFLRRDFDGLMQSLEEIAKQAPPVPNTAQA